MTRLPFASETYMMLRDVQNEQSHARGRKSAGLMAVVNCSLTPPQRQAPFSVAGADLEFIA
jgi:hypothetical protein